MIVAKIKMEKIPENCKICPVKEWKYGRPRAILENKYIDYNQYYENGEKWEEKRPAWCQLMEVEDEKV